MLNVLHQEGGIRGEARRSSIALMLVFAVVHVILTVLAFTNRSAHATHGCVDM